MGRDLTGRVAAITGASSGIGAALALACGRRGMRLGLFARRAERLADVAAEVERAGGEALVVTGDVRDRGTVEEWVTTITRRWGRLDAMIPNAGFGITALVAETPPEEAREIFDVNVLGTIWAIQAAWPIFAMQGKGHYVIVSSAIAKSGLPSTALYSATKAAQMNLAEGLRIEAASIGVDVSVVYPVVTRTEFREASRDHSEVDPEGRDSLYRGPIQTAEHVADAIVGCLSRPRFEVYPFRPARLLPWFEAINPRFLAGVFRFEKYYRTQLGLEE